MSEVERNKGILKPLFAANSMQSDHLQDYLDENYDTKILLDGLVYDVVYEVRRDTDAYNFAEVARNPDGSMNFHTLHYNGGCLSDVIIGALKSLDE